MYIYINHNKNPQIWSKLTEYRDKKRKLKALTRQTHQEINLVRFRRHRRQETGICSFEWLPMSYPFKTLIFQSKWKGRRFFLWIPRETDEKPPGGRWSTEAQHMAVASIRSYFSPAFWLLRFRYVLLFLHSTYYNIVFLYN